MFRKTIIALAATASLAAVALAPTSASAWSGHHHHRGHGHGWFGPAIVAGAILGTAAIVASSCYRYRWVETPDGLQKVRVNVC